MPFALLRRSIATWWRAHQPSWLAGGVGSGAWLGAAGWSLLAACLGGQGLLHRLLNQGLQVGRRAHRRDGGGGGGTAACPAAAVALLAERVELGLPLPGLVDEILHPGRQVLHAARQLGIGHVSHGVHKF